MKLDRLTRRRLFVCAAALCASLALIAAALLLGRARSPADAIAVRRSPYPLTQEELSGAATPEPAPGPTHGPEAPDGIGRRPDAALQKLLDEGCPAENGTWDLLVYCPDDGRFAARSDGGDSPSVSASLIKLFVMGAVFERFGEPDAALAVEVRDMIALSDNEAANRLIRLLGDGDDEAGMDAVNAFADSLGCRSTRLRRLMLVENGLQNTTSADDCALLLEALYRRKLVSPEASEAMLALLEAQTVNDRIPALLPPDTVCAHKTGDLTGLCCGDVGLVRAPGATYIFCAICGEPASLSIAASDIAALSLAVYEELS